MPVKLGGTYRLMCNRYSRFAHTKYLPDLINPVGLSYLFSHFASALTVDSLTFFPPSPEFMDFLCD